MRTWDRSSWTTIGAALTVTVAAAVTVALPATTLRFCTVEFSDFGAALPAPTMFLCDFWWQAIPAGLVVTAPALIALRQPSQRSALRWLLLFISLMGQVLVAVWHGLFLAAPYGYWPWF